MLSSAEFIDFILKGGGRQATPAETPASAALPEGFEGFDAGAEHNATAAGGATSFARRLLEAAGFGLAQLVERSSVIRSADAVAKYLPERASYWPKTATRPYQTLLFEAGMTSGGLLKIPAFRNTELRHLDDVEAALARLVSEALDGFQKGGEGVTADVRKGRREETLCIVSIIDQREGQSVRLVCFGTRNKQSAGLETFQITEQTRFWDPQLARDHLGLLYERQFKKLAGADWQDAFTTTDERKQAEKLLDICTRKTPKEHDIQEGVLDLLDIIAKAFGLRRKPNTERRLQAFSLPSDHDIGIDPEDREGSFGGHNPFGGVTLRDERSRLLGYIVYPLNNKADASRLRKHLAENNRFHNVLVVYPDNDQASLELWQGREQLTGKLRKGKGYKDAADVVNLLSRFFVVSKAKVRNPTELAQELAYRARYLRRLAVKQLGEEKNKGPLRNLYNAFRKVLVHDQTEDEFADSFAQTITYGLLTARWVGNDQLAIDGERLTRQTALKHLPAASPFLNDVFKSALSVRLDEQRGRFLWLVDDIADLLDRIDVTYVFGAGDKGSDPATDPVIHFYEPFLAAYDKELKNKRGVFYTPRPVVSYIVRSVHELLQTEFGLADGLADTTTWGEMLQMHPGLKLPPLTDMQGETETISPDEPFVQILDPATGTATFLVEVIDVIHRTLAAKWKQQRLTDSQQRAAWNDYVPQHLLPRLHAFELMMAPYAIAHMKIGLKLAETGYRFGTEERARIYLTNALEPWVKQLPLIGFDALAHEAAAVNEIKRHKRFTVIIGNPPYSVSSWNTGEWITKLAEDYKRTVRAEESQIQSLSNDYIKFLRFSEWHVERTNTGILGLITGHGYLSGTQPRDLRNHLSSSLDKCYCLDLHGSVRRAGTHDTEDEPVFEIMTGVAIVIGFRAIEHQDRAFTSLMSLTGRSVKKFEFLGKQTALVGTTASPLHRPCAPHFYFAAAASGQAIEHEYQRYPDLPSIYGTGNRQADKEKLWATGFTSQQDELAVAFTLDELVENMSALATSRSFDELASRYRLCTTNQWNYGEARRFAQSGEWRKLCRQVLYRPFDRRWTVLHKHVLTILRSQVMSQLDQDCNSTYNFGLISSRAVNDLAFAHCFVTNERVDRTFISSKTSTNAYVFPLYFTEDGILGRKRRVNYSHGFLATLANLLGARFDPEQAAPEGLTFEDIFHYAYAIFHSPGYRSRYAEFLKIDFPRLPLTGNLELFRALARLGSELTALHLLESPKLAQPITVFIGGRNPEVEKISWSRNTVWVDKAQTTGFKGVREDVWNFHIGGYQVCKKWLDDRRKAKRSLSNDDIVHYHKIVVAITETVRLMREIDQVIEERGGWPAAFARTSTGEPE